jgi:SAM-dependent methyltransferase
MKKSESLNAHNYGHGPAIIGNAGSHDTLRHLLEKMPPCRVLDVPCGHGPIAYFLKTKNWEVHCADIDRAHLQVEGIPFTQVDLNRILPFDNASFDAITCVNGIQRLFNPGGAIQEFHRILRPGGTLFINWNNYSSLHRRIRFLLYGMLDQGVTEGVCKQSLDAPEANVRNPILLPQVLDLLHREGFEVVTVLPSAKRWYLEVGKGLAALIRVLVWMFPWKGQEERTRQANSSAAFPGGVYICVEARKKAFS